MEEYNDQEMFDLKPILAEIYSSSSSSSSSSSQPLISCKEPQASDHDIDDVKQQLMNMISSNNTIWESNSHNPQDHIITTKPSSSSSSAQNIISFENSFLPPNSDIIINNSNNDTSPIMAAANIGTDIVSSQVIDFSFSAAKHIDSMASNGVIISQQKRDFTATRTPSQAHEHLLAERKHREHLRQLFISLSKLVPGLKKLDKASLLEDATKYMKSLQERVAVLEQEEMKEITSASQIIDASKIYDCSSSSYIDNNHIHSNGDDRKITSELLAVPEIKASISERHVLINICCKKEMGLIMSRLIPSEMAKLDLSVLEIRMMPFGGAALTDITILAETQSELQGTVEDIVDQLQRVLLLNPCTNNNIDMQDDDHHTTK